jgi:formylglycine-generating enzyme required for sulfatase activity
MSVSRAAIVTAVGSGFLAVAAIAGVIVLATEQRSDPARCPEGLIELGPRCCAPGQTLERDRCVGAAKSCSKGLTRTTDPIPACVALPLRIHYAGGDLHLAPNDWEAQGIVQPRDAHVAPFELDTIEVTEQRYAECVKDEKCTRLGEDSEPGRARGGLSVAQAKAVCAYGNGRLPTSDEWLFAAAGATGRKFPWGATGLVCRRAVFGVVDGPCGTGAAGPELAGSRPDGASPEGALDLTGNVAEWTVERDGSFVARGGSFHSTVAGELVTWAAERVSGAAPEIGARCAYDVGAPGQ